MQGHNTQSIKGVEKGRGEEGKEKKNISQASETEMQTSRRV